MSIRCFNIIIFGLDLAGVGMDTRLFDAHKQSRNNST